MFPRPIRQIDDIDAQSAISLLVELGFGKLEACEKVLIARANLPKGDLEALVNFAIRL